MSSSEREKKKALLSASEFSHSCIGSLESCVNGRVLQLGHREPVNFFYHSSEGIQMCALHFTQKRSPKKMTVWGLESCSG